MNTNTPINDYRVELEAYEGPLDLLLYLVKRHEIDLYDIPIAELTDQYIQHIAAIQEVDIERAGDFLVMAATLLEIKSQMLVPAVAAADDEDDAADEKTMDEADPRYELVQQLLAYKRFKDAAMDLEDQLKDWEARYPLKPARHRGPGDEPQTTAEEREFDLEDVDVMVLFGAFSRILESIGAVAEHHVEYDDTPISLHEDDIVDRLTREGVSGSGRGLTMKQIFEGRKSRGEMIGLFLALLELVRQRKVAVQQDQRDPSGEITLNLRDPDEAARDAAANDAEPSWRNAETGEVEYAWPSEAAREYAQRRAKRMSDKLARLRGGGQSSATDGENDDDDQGVAISELE